MDIIQWTKQSSETEKEKENTKLTFCLQKKIIFSVQKL